jgi:hypothetical protein
MRETGVRTTGVVSWGIVLSVCVLSEAGAQDVDVRGLLPRESWRVVEECPEAWPEAAPAWNEAFASRAFKGDPSGRAAEAPPTELPFRPLALGEDVFLEDEDPGAQEGQHAPLSDLTLLNFFTEGWSDPWVHRHRKTRDMALLRVTTNFLEREFRLDYQGTPHVHGSATVTRTDFLNGLIAYGVDRRLMLEVVANYQWNHNGANLAQGPGAAVVARFQLVDTEESSYAFQMRASAPNRGLGQFATTLSPTLAGWQDLDAALGLDQVGLYYSLTWDSLQGRVAAGARTDSLSYDITLAKTWTDAKTAGIGSFTTFVETLATTDFNGPTPSRTLVSVTPGIRFWFVTEQSLTLGVDIPVSYPHLYSEILRITYILNF